MANNYFTFSPLHSTDKFSNEHQILSLTEVERQHFASFDGHPFGLSLGESFLVRGIRGVRARAFVGVVVVQPDLLFSPAEILI